MHFFVAQARKITFTFGGFNNKIILMKNNRVILLLPLLLTLFCCAKNTDNNDTPKPQPVDDGLVTVKFDTCTDLETNYIEDQRLEPGSLIKEPSVVTPMDDRLNIRITGWYQENNYVNKWNFLSDTVSKDMTLYAKWAETITISYYLKGSTSPIWTVSNAAKGEPLELHDELCDGYKFLGYYVDPECTIPFDLATPLESSTSVYLYRGDVLTYNAAAIKRRFSMFAAGGNGSREGNISKVETGDDGISYVDVNFGYSTTADPYMRTSNPQIDVSKSQKIGVKFKNFGNASSMSFYWVSKYANGSYASGIGYESEDNCVHVTLEDEEKNMTEDSPWVDKVVDLSEKTTSGVSGWGNSVTMISLRIQFEYVSKNDRDLSNVVRFAEIYGVSDNTHVGFNDSQEVSNMLHNDSESAINAVKATQTQNRGVIFPLDEEYVSADSSTHFMKEEGILLYSRYDTDINKFIFDVSNQSIDASNYSFVTMKMRNLSYINSLTINIITISPRTGRPTSNNAAITLTKRMTEKDEFVVNLYGRTNMVGVISSITISFNVNGVDNAMLLESITLSENRPYQISGINFDDIKSAGFVSNEHVDVSYNKTLKASTFVTNGSSDITRHLNYDFETYAYSYIALNYYYSQNGITSIKAVLTYSDNSTGEYVFNNFTISNDLQTITLPLNETGALKDVTLEFTGAGTIDISNIKFLLEGENACDLSSISTFNSFLPDWAKPLSYIDDKEATLFNSKTDFARYYFGYLFKDGRRDYGNISLNGKTKIYIIYQNQKPTGGFFLDVYAVDKRTNSEYMTSISEASPIMNDVNFTVSSNMNVNSWKVASVDIPAAYRNNENFYISNIRFGIRNSEDTTMYLRGVVFK